MNEYDYLNEQYNTQSKLQNEASQEQAKLYAPQLKEQIAEAQAAIISQTNPSRAIKVIVEGFRGNMIDENGDVIKIGFPLMNEKGIARVSSMLIPFISDPIRFGKIKATEVRHIALKTVNDITQDIGLNWREYGITEPTNRDIILDACLALILITLTRSEEQSEKNWLGRIVLESVQGNKQPQRKKESFIEKFLKI